MILVFSDSAERKIVKPERIDFTLETAGIHLIEISAQAQGEKQLGTTDDEDLRIEIDNRKFPFLGNLDKYFDSPASFSGGTLHGRKKIIFFVIWLSEGKHTVSLVPDIAATLLEINVVEVSEDSATNTLQLPLQAQAEDGDRRPWLTFVCVDCSLSEFSAELILHRRFLDSDDVKIITDGFIKRNNQSKFRKFWYFIASLLKGERQTESFPVNLPSGLHYIEFWADRMPILEKITFSNLVFKIPVTIQEKIEYRAKQFGFDPTMILRLAKRESQFNPKAMSDAGAKGIFQLTDITIKQIQELGFKITDPYDIDQNIEGGLTYFNWLYRRYEGQKDHIQKTLAAWNWGLSHIPVKGSLDFGILPDETKKFITDILGDHDF